MVTMRLTREVHCRLPEALQAMETFAILYGESRLAASGRPGIEYLCELLDGDLANRAAAPCDVFFVHWTSSPRFQVPALYGVVSAAPNGLTTTIAFDATYEPELGIIGALFDRCIGRRFAERSVNAFFARLLHFVEQEAGLDRLLDRLVHYC
jgi:hypothetical protein